MGIRRPGRDRRRPADNRDLGLFRRHRIGDARSKAEPRRPVTTYHFEYGLAECPKGCTKVPVPDASIPAGTSPVVVKETVGGLAPNTTYHFRLVARNPAVANGPDRTFTTYAPPLTGLPDSRAYEQATPVEQGRRRRGGHRRAGEGRRRRERHHLRLHLRHPRRRRCPGAADVPGAAGGSSWSTRGLLPPASTAERAQVLGWAPNFSEVFTNATFLGAPWTEALLEQSPADRGTRSAHPLRRERQVRLCRRLRRRLNRALRITGRPAGRRRRTRGRRLQPLRLGRRQAAEPRQRAQHQSRDRSRPAPRRLRRAL